MQWAIIGSLKEREDSAEASVHAVIDSVDIVIDGVKVPLERFVSNEMLVIYERHLKSTDWWAYLMGVLTVLHALLPWFSFMVRTEIVGV